MSNWTEEKEAVLTAGVSDPVSQEVVAQKAEELDRSPRSISAKLRKLGFEVEKVGDRKKTFSEDETEDLAEFVADNSGEYTYAEIAENFLDGRFSSRQIQGKILSMELTGDVKPTPEPVSTKSYSDDEEETIVRLVDAGAKLEDIADALDRPLNSVRGKCLSMSKTHGIEIPEQRESHAKVKVDPFEAIDNIEDLTVKQIAETVEKSPRGVKVMLTHRGIKVQDWDGAARKEKNEEKKKAKKAA